MKNVSNGHGRRTSCKVVSKRHKKVTMYLIVIEGDLLISNDNKIKIYFSSYHKFYHNQDVNNTLTVLHMYPCA